MPNKSLHEHGKTAARKLAEVFGRAPDKNDYWSKKSTDAYKTMVKNLAEAVKRQRRQR